MQKAKAHSAFPSLAPARTPVLAPVLAMALALASSTPAIAAGGWSFSLGGLGSANLLAELTAKASLDISKAEPVSVEGPDGPMPEIARQVIPLAAGTADPIPTLKKACADIGLAQPDADQIAVEPDTICTGMWNDKRMQVNAALQCKTRPCLLYIETSAFGF